MATTQDEEVMGDTNSSSNEHYLSEGLVINIFVNNGSADSCLSPLVNLYAKIQH